MENANQLFIVRAGSRTLPQDRQSIHSILRVYELSFPFTALDINEYLGL